MLNAVLQVGVVPNVNVRVGVAMALATGGDNIAPAPVTGSYSDGAGVAGVTATLQVRHPPR
jgi:hypothetical protein